MKFQHSKVGALSTIAQWARERSRGTELAERDREKLPLQRPVEIKQNTRKSHRKDKVGGDTRTPFNATSSIPPPSACKSNWVRLASNFIFLFSLFWVFSYSKSNLLLKFDYFYVLCSDYMSSLRHLRERNICPLL